MQTRLYTVEDLDSIKERVELDRGFLVPVNVPNWLHGMCTARFTNVLSDYVRQHELGVVLSNDSGYILERNPDTVRGPDVSFIRRSRLKDLQRGKYPDGGPDLVVEVLSPANSPGEILRKVGQYLEAGTSRVWVADPERERVTAYYPDGLVEVLDGDDRLTCEDVLPGFDHLVADLFQFW